MWTANKRIWIAVCVLCLMGAGSALLAQAHRAIISGSVVDPSGAIVPGAEVRVIHQSTNIAHETITNDSGYYEAPGLLPGQYRIEAALTGFKTAVVEDIPVASAERVRVDLSLDVGEVSDTVTVTSDPTLLQSANAEVGVAFGQKPLAVLPMGQGNPTYLFLLSPSADSAGGYGSQSTNQEPYQRAGAGLVRFNGMPTGTAEFTMDGTPNTQRTNAVDGGAVSFNATTELVKEVRIQTTTFDASVGHTGSTTIDVIMKTGTNQFHGEAFYFGRNDKFNANSWVRNRAGQERTSFPYKRYGFTGGGPIIKDKTFIFLGWTHWGQTRFGDSQATVPSAANKAGDFSDLLALGPEYQLYNPFTGVVNEDGRVERQPFENNIIPSNLISPMAAPLLPFFLAANNPSGAEPDGFRNYLYDSGYTPLPRTDRHTVLRLDHDLNDSHTLFGRYLHSDGPSSGWTMWDNHPGGPGCGCVDVHGTRHQIWNFSVGDVWTITPTFVADFRVANNRHTSKSRNNAGGLTWDDLPTNMNQFIDSEFAGFPYVEITGYPKLSAISGHNGFTNFDPGGSVDEIRSASAHFTKVSGDHSFRFGGEWRGYIYNIIRSDQARMSFTGQFSSGPFDNSPSPPRGHGLSDLLLGLHSNTNQRTRADYANYSTYTAIYLQDDWKITPRFTLNLGLRWSREGPSTERHDQAVTQWDTSVESPISAEVQANYALNPIPEIPVDQFRLMGGVLYAGVGGEPRTIYDADNNNFSPRIGMAYRWNDKTVVKGGYSYTYVPLNQRYFAGWINVPGFDSATNAFSSTDGGLTFPGSLNNLFPDGISEPTGSSAGLKTDLGQRIWMPHGFDRSSRNPWAHQFQFGIQRRLSPNATVEVRYVGNRARGFGVSASQLNKLRGQYLTRSIERDQAHIDYITERIPNPFQGVEGVGGSLGVASVIQRHQLLTPWPHISDLRSWADASNSLTDYNALQVEFRAQELWGWEIQSSYTWSKTMEALSYLNGFGIDPEPQYTIGINDRPAVFRFAGTYRFPFGKGQRFGASSGAASYLISGWSTTFIGYAQSGIPTKWGNIIFRGDIKDIPVQNKEWTRMFNQDAGFERGSANQPSFNLRTFPLRLSGVRDEGPRDVGFTLIKDTYIGERFNAQFRFEAYNLFNAHYFWGNHRNAVNTNPRSSGFGTQGFSSGPRIVQFGVKFVF